tara:strand:- start:8339 stop:9241 length:903 start_codon:yes stop_codon:yes gene_type:complete
MSKFISYGASGFSKFMYPLYLFKNDRKRLAFWKKEHQIFMQLGQEIDKLYGYEGILALMKIISSHHLKKRLLLLNKVNEYIKYFDYWFPDSRTICSIESAIPRYKYRENTLQRNPKEDIEGKVSLLSMPVLTFPWTIDRFKNCMGYIGTDHDNPWKQDEYNHYMAYFHPFSIGWIHNGNHSIATGMIKGEGEVTPRYYYDMSHIYSRIAFDGVKWKYDKDYNCPAANNFEYVGTLYELSRFIKSSGVGMLEVLSIEKKVKEEQIIDLIKAKHERFYFDEIKLDSMINEHFYKAIQDSNNG